MLDTGDGNRYDGQGCDAARVYNCLRHLSYRSTRAQANLSFTGLRIAGDLGTRFRRVNAGLRAMDNLEKDTPSDYK